MKAIVYDRTGDPSVLRLAQKDMAEPGPGEVRVRVVVSGVNPTDWKTRRGSSTGQTEEVPTVPNQDGAGVIDAVGAGVGTVAVGDRVWITLAAYQRPGSGTAQEYTVVPAERVFPLDAGASFELGASVGIPALTAHRALTVADGGPDRLRPGALAGRTVLVAGGAGAVGHAAIQLARWAGASVVSTVSNPAKGALATAAGAHHVVNYTEPDYLAHLRAAAPDGVDMIVEVAVGRNDATNRELLKSRGTIAVYANNGDEPFHLDVRQAMGLNARYQFVLLYTVGWDILSAAAEDVNAAIAAGALEVGDGSGLPLHFFPLERAAEAHAAVESETVGKVLITVGQP